MGYIRDALGSCDRRYADRAGVLCYTFEVESLFSFFPFACRSAWVTRRPDCWRRGDRLWVAEWEFLLLAVALG
jgi:hypothetical protein